MTSEEISEQFIRRDAWMRRRTWQERLFSRPWRPWLATVSGEGVRYACGILDGPLFRDRPDTIVHVNADAIRLCIPKLVEPPLVRWNSEGFDSAGWRAWPRFGEITYQRVVVDGRPMLKFVSETGIQPPTTTIEVFLAHGPWCDGDPAREFPEQMGPDVQLCAVCSAYLRAMRLPAPQMISAGELHAIRKERQPGGRLR